MIIIADLGEKVNYKGDREAAKAGTFKQIAASQKGVLFLWVPANACVCGVKAGATE